MRTPGARLEGGVDAGQGRVPTKARSSSWWLVPGSCVPLAPARGVSVVVLAKAGV